MSYKNGYRVVSSKYNKKLWKSYGYRVVLSKKNNKRYKKGNMEQYKQRYQKKKRTETQKCQE